MNPNLEAVEREIAENRAQIELKRKLDRLFDNRDFQDIILEKYFRDEPARLVKQRADPAIQEKATLLAAVDNAISAIGFFFQFLNGIDQKGRTAEYNLRQNQETLQEMLSEDE